MNKAHYRSWALPVLSPAEAKREQECPDRVRGQCRRINKEAGITIQFPIDTCNLCWAAGPDTQQGEKMRRRVILTWQNGKPPAPIHRSLSPCKTQRIADSYGEVYARKLIDEATLKSEEKVLVVGNGPSALNEKWGSFIDEWFDVIVRVNKGAFVGDKIPFKDYGEVQTESFAEYVGTRTDMWATWADWTPRFPCDTLFISTHRGVFQPHHKKFIQRIPENIKIIGGRDHVMRMLLADLQRLKPGYRSNPSTGMQVVAELLTRYARVHIIGFDHFSAFNHETGRGHHFYEPPEVQWKRGGEIKNPGHTSDERLWFEWQEKQGRVIRLENEGAWREHEHQQQG